MKYLSIAILLVLAITLVGCELTFESPVCVSPLATPTLPSPSPSKGIIIGRFVDYNSREPAAEMIVYLGTLSPLKGGDTDSYIVVMLPSSSPKTATDRNGYFAFLDVEPGTYAMVMWTPGSSWVVTDPQTDLSILVTVKAGAITDLGELAIGLPDY